MTRKIGSLLLCLLFGIMPLAGCDGGKASTGEGDQPTVNYNLKTAELPFRDICVLADAATQTYYMVGFLKSYPSAQEVAMYQSKDLENWGGYTTAVYNDGQWDQSWAPEIHEYKGEYYIIGSLQGHAITGDLRGCYFLKADKARAVYEMHSERITPEDWQCLDGTLYVEDGIPYMIYCREWVRMIDGNGEMYAVRLKDDLSGPYPGAEHVKLFAARDHKASDDGVTDGCYMYKANNGDLVMFWSKYVNGKYTVITSRSKSGKLFGEWTHDTTPLFSNDGGHPMVFTDFDGNTRIAFHTNSANKGNEFPVVYYLEDNNGVLAIKDENGKIVS